jgi:SNF2 family DNA or RNA helicase
VGAGGLLLVSYATAAADQALLLELFSRFKVMLVVDESHRIKRFRGGLWASTMVELARASRVRQVLSGTPMPQSGKDLYSQLNVIWPDQQLTGNRDAFASRVDRDFARVTSTVLPFVHRTPKSALGLQPYEVFEHSVPLHGIQAEVYRLIANRFRQSIVDAKSWQDKLEALRRGRPIRLLQAAANPDLLNSGDAFFATPRISGENPTLMERLATYPSRETPAKSLAALDIIRQVAADGGKVVCWSNFISNLDHFSSLVKEHLGLPVFQVDGRVPSGDDALHAAATNADERPGETDTREQIIARFLDSPGPAVLVTNPASCSESISLHRTCWNAIYLDRTYDCALYLQSIDRIHRLGLPPDARVQIHVLSAELDASPTIDGLVAAALARKARVMQMLLEGAELLPVGLADDPSTDAEGDDADLAELLRYLLGELSDAGA